MFRLFCLSFAISFGGGYVILRYARADSPRIGGVPVFIGCAAAIAAGIHEV
jgi:hypothetical protein